MGDAGFAKSQEALAFVPVSVLATDPPKGTLFAEHAHDSGQLIHAISGVMVVRTEAGSWVVPTGRAVWVPGGMRHEIEMPVDVRMRTVYVAPPACRELPQSCKVLLAGPLLRELIVAAADIGPATGCGPREQRILDLILDEIVRVPSQQLHVPMPRHPGLAALCAEFVACPAGDATQQAWAARAHMTPRTFARAFERETGMTHATWCRYARVVLSLPQLAAGVPVLAVALDHGYDSPSAFAAMFRKVLGVAPSDYFRQA